MADLAQLVKQRGLIKSKLTRFQSFLNKLPVENLSREDRGLLESKSQELPSMLSEFNAMQQKLCLLIEENDMEALEQESEEFEEKYHKAHSLANILKNTENVTTNAPLPVISNKISKPTIHLPTFDGSFDKWYHFRDLFKNMIHSDTTLSDVEKLHYLNVCLKGEAASILNCISISDNNYSLAWDLLNERFDNKQLIVHSHIQSLFNMSSIKRDSYKDLQELLDTLLWHLRSLERLELSLKSWDPLIIYLVTTKLDATSKREWDTLTSNNVNELPKWDDLLTCLNKRCRLLSKSSLVSENNQSATRVKSRVLLTTNKGNCQYCDQSHSIMQCDAFQHLNVHNRMNEVKKRHLCFNCLGKGHNTKSCKSKYTCKYCSRKHNSLLHIENATIAPKIDASSLTPSTSVTMATNTEISQIILSTVLIRVADSSGAWHTCRALLDSGSQSNFITSDLCKKLNLVKHPLHSVVSGISQAGINLKYRSDVNISSKYSSYEQLGHMKLLQQCADDSIDECEGYFLPHHAVVKSSSTTTRTRVVFDGSAKTDTGLSLNDVQKVGPLIQDDIFALLLRFRYHPFVLTADIEKMYRQILLSESDRKYHRILWRPDSSQEVKCYELQTVTYGTASASFLATRCLHQVAIDNGSQYPNACNVIKRDFYVDDLLTGANSVCELNQLQHELSIILNSAGFNLRKWLTNAPIKFKESNEAMQLEFGDNCVSRTLGIIWNSSTDSFNYRISELDYPKQVTKRTILSTTAKIFDPLGLLAPVIVVAKLILQKLWQCQLSWDESVSQALHHNWLKFLDGISSSDTITIPRFVLQSNFRVIECHGFADASERAYGSCVYIRSVDSNGHCTIHLLCAKSRVAPLRQITLPRLELCAAVLLTELITKVKKSFNIRFDSYYFWSDSTITLSWIRSSPSRWQTFVANRIAKIQSSTDPSEWAHVSSKDNPADLLSRGTSPNILSNLPLWWHGPAWLAKDSSEWPLRGDTIMQPEKLPELRKNTILVANTVKCDLFEKFSNYTKLIRVTAWILRFKHNCRAEHTSKQIGPLSANELDIPLVSLVKIVQNQAFPQEIKNLQANSDRPVSGNLLSLNPFLDKNNVLRVGGRISQSNFSFNKKHPMILPKHHLFTDMIVRYEHKRLLHAGTQTVLSSLRERFWPISGRNTIKRIIHECVICFKANPAPTQHIMGKLPGFRITPTNVFEKCGVDYAGPFMTKDKRSRGSRISKAYLCVFICMVTKAVHLELVTALTTDAFISTLRRFISRRGKPVSLYSDNGTNFVGADRELRTLSRLARDSNFQDFVSNEGISWHFMPPRSPHFGGLWEAGIKSAKAHLKRVLHNASLTFEDFYTVLTQIEAVLNSRPLSPLSNDPSDLNPLTPGHFLIGRPLTSISDPCVLDIRENRLSHFQRLQRLTQHFWTRWNKEYLSELQTRTKWKTNSSRRISIGDLVIIREENLPPLKWKMGRIIEIHQGEDSVVRVVDIKTESGTIKRAVRNVCVLPISAN